MRADFDIKDALLAGVRIRLLNDKLNALEADTQNSLPALDEYASTLEYSNLKAELACQKFELSLDKLIKEKGIPKDIPNKEADAFNTLAERISIWKEHLLIQPESKDQKTALQTIKEIELGYTKSTAGIEEAPNEVAQTLTAQTPKINKTKSLGRMVATQKAIDILNQKVQAFASNSAPILTAGTNTETALTTSTMHSQSSTEFLRDKIIKYAKGKVSLKETLHSEKTALKNIRGVITGFDYLLNDKSKRNPTSPELANWRKEMRSIQEDFNSIILQSLNKDVHEKAAATKSNEKSKPDTQLSSTKASIQRIFKLGQQTRGTSPSPQLLKNMGPS